MEDTFNGLRLLDYMGELELWREYRLSGYWVSSYGRVWSEHGGGLLGLVGDVYLRVCFRDRRFRYVHRLVGEVFLDVPVAADGFELRLRHVGDTQDNWHGNLRWDVVVKKERFHARKKPRVRGDGRNKVCEFREVLDYIDSRRNSVMLENLKYRREMEAMYEV